MSHTVSARTTHHEADEPTMIRDDVVQAQFHMRITRETCDGLSPPQRNQMISNIKDAGTLNGSVALVRALATLFPNVWRREWGTLW